ncbi:MAG: YybH family protein [Thermodesulfobacteriota bacterium]|uniref:YybH family protein n=1 Tax=Candidatus Jordarchaeum sp. TaxID=2823881 RepID=UPI00404965FB
MKKLSFIYLFVLFFLPQIVFSNQVAEEQIKKVLSNFEKSWNKRDLEGFISCFHNDARIMTGGDRRFVSKEEYKKIIPQRWQQWGELNFEKPNIEISECGKKAKVIVTAKFSVMGVKFVFYMVPQEDRWLILVQEY